MKRAPSIQLYCHNVIGLGHIVRSTRIAAALRARAPEADVRIISGCRAMHALDWPEGVGLTSLPPLTVKELSSPAGLAVLARRQHLLHESIAATKPDVLVVDFSPSGLNGELTATLKAAEAEHWPTRMVLGVPYPFLTGPRPAHPRVRPVLSFYHALLGYADPSAEPVLDGLPSDGRPELAHYTGYVAERLAQPAPARPPEKPSGPPLVTVLNGGGSRSTIFTLIASALLPMVTEGRIRLRVVVGALNPDGLPSSIVGVPGVELIPAMGATEAARGASLIVTRCGYNTAFAITQLPVPVVFLPDEMPTGEQWARGRVLARLDRVWVIEGQAGSLRLAVEEGLRAAAGPRHIPFALDGADQAAQWLLDVMVPRAHGLETAP